MRERLRVVARILESLAQGEIEMKPVFLRQVVAPQLRLDGGYFRGIESERLEIRQTPIGFAKIRRLGDASAIRFDAVVLAAGGGEGVTS